jgi:integrase
MLDSTYKEELEDGKVLLFTRDGIFQARVYKGNRQYINRSLKTRKLDDARKLAVKFLHEIEFRKQEQLPLQQRTFNDVITEYIKLREQQYEQSQKTGVNTSRKQGTSIHMLKQIRRVSKFWIAYCGKTPVSKIDNAKLADYIQWRKDYYSLMPADKIPKAAKKHPTDSTLVWETTLAKTLIKFAHERGYRGNSQLPTWRYKAERRIVRPAFTPAEYKKEYEQMRRWIKETEDPEYKYIRELLRDYVLILANSGMRVGEANNLKESDVELFVDELGRKNYMLRVKGKTGSRIVIPRTGALRYINRVFERNKARRIEEEHAQRTTRSPKRKIDSKDGEWFFSMYDGSKIITLIDQFQTVLKAIDLLENRYKERFTLYSLRHFYAVGRIRKGIPIYDIAANMGTSVQMIEQYYGRQATTLALAANLGR